MAGAPPVFRVALLVQRVTGGPLLFRPAKGSAPKFTFTRLRRYRL